MANADRELVFGMLALQNGLIDQVQLVAAFQAWTRDKSRPLSEHLAARGDLDAEQRAGIEAMLNLHLRKHGGDAARSLAAIPAGHSTLESLTRIGDSDLSATLTQATSTLSDPEDADRTASYAVGSATSDGQRFRTLRPHAKGGLGAVFIALDAELNREVALKRILDHHADDPTSRQRFLLEAEVTGGLEHPGIVPVYGLGTYGDGRPFYAMRFIDGDTLGTAIGRFHADASLKTDPSRRSLELRQLLRRFLDVCNALGYAHARGVLHRDIKPGNVIVGRHGETLVVDWGLAKATGRSEPGSSERMLTPTSVSGSAETLPGSALGTPSYMSPEQARGELDRMGPRSDVYSLGATLYCLLTGRAPLLGEVGEVLRNVQEGAFPPPRALDPSIDRALEAVCLKAMALQPEDRYDSCRLLADDLERWLADEPVTAWGEPWTVRARRWAKRNRTLVTSSAAALVVTIAGLTLGLFLLDAARRRESRLNENLKTANTRLNNANTELGQANASLSKALKDVETANTKANQRLDQTMEAIRDYYTGISEDVLLGRKEFRDLREKLLAKPLSFYESMTRELEAAPTDARSRALLADGRLSLGRIFFNMGRYEDSRKESRTAVAAYEALIAAEPDVPQHQDGLATSYRYLGLALRYLSDLPGAIEAHRKAVEWGEALHAIQPGEPKYQNRLVASYSDLGLTLRVTGDLRGAVEAHRKAVERCEALMTLQPGVPQYQSRLAASYINLGIALRDLGDLEGSIEAYRKGVEQYESLAAVQPGLPEYQFGLAVNYNNLAGSLEAKGDRNGAIAAYRKAIEWGEKLIAVRPGVPEYQHLLATAYGNLGYALLSTGDLPGATGALRKAIERGDTLVAAHPGVPEYQNGLMNHHRNLGVVMFASGDTKGGVDEFRTVVKQREAIVIDHPNVPEYLSLLASDYSNLAEAFRETGDLEGSAAVCLKATEQGETLVAAHPDAPVHRDRLASNYVTLGLLHQKRDHHEEAVAVFRKAIEHRRIALKAAPLNVDFQQGLKNDYIRLITSLRALKRDREADEAEAEMRKLQDPQRRLDWELPANPFAP